MILNMKKLTFLVTNKEYDKFICDIRDLGAVHIDMLQQGATSDELTSALALADRYKAAIKALDFAQESYTPKQQYTAKPANANEGVSLVKQVEKLVAEENDIKHQLDAVEKDINLMEPWGEFSWETIRTLEKSGYVPYFYCVGTKQYKAEWAEKFYATAVNELNKKTYFVAFSNEGDPDITAERLYLPEKSLSELRKKDKSLNEQLEEVRENLLRINAESRASILAGQIAADNDIALSKVHLSNESIAGDQVKLMIGWCLEENAPQIVDYLDKTGIYYELEDPAFEDEVPVKIKNDKFSSLFEPILRLYSLPNYNDIDPTIFFAPFFMLFFGLCMGDGGYGLLILGVGLYLMFKGSESVKSYGQLATCLGAMTMICGLATGTVFGINLTEQSWAFLAPYKKYMLSDSGCGPIFGYSPMMVLSVIIGLVQVLIGMTLKACKSWKNYGFAYAIGTFSWIVLIITALIMLAVPEDMVAVKYALYAVLGVCSVGIFLYNSPGAYKNPVLGPLMNIGSGLWATYGMITGLLGDLLSYIRLFALGLTGGILGFVFNSLAFDITREMPVVVKWPLLLIILLFGHGLTFALSMISAFVHPMRLTFVEFFKNADYAGGGKEFTPFEKKK